jgi:BolA protein
VAPCFAGMPTLDRHRAVYDAVDEMMPAEIHALAVRALSPDEIQ